MTTKANWHLDVDVDQSDPFAAPIRDVRHGVRLDLANPVHLQAKLVALMLREGELAEQGLTCELKQREDSCCSACPLAGSHGKLCKVGVEQERTLMSMLASDA